MIFIFKMMAFCHLKFLNFDFFFWPKVSLKSVYVFWDIAIFSIFKMAAISHVGFLKYLNFIGWWGERANMYHHAKFIKISQSIAEISWFFFIFFKIVAVCYLAFLKSDCFLYSAGKQISTKSVNRFPRYRNFFIFHGCHLGF